MSRWRWFAVGLSGLAALVVLAPFNNCSGQFKVANFSSSASSTSAGDLAVTPAPTDDGSATGIAATSANVFLSSLGICIHHAQGPSVASYVAPLNFLGVRNVRDDAGPASDYVDLHQKTGVLVNLLPVNGDVAATIQKVRIIAQGGALLSIEGPNEPNNWPITYNGEKGGGSGTWVPLAKFQRDLYAAVKADPILAAYPVFGITETGGEVDNAGVQFNVIPAGAGALLPDGTVFSDYANTHNYVSGTANKYVDNQAWQAADPVLNGAWDGFYVEHGHTWWGSGFAGYTVDQLPSVPRVTTETGWDSKGNAGGERTQGTVLLNTYLAQFKRGWRYTFIYMLRDGEGGDGNQGVFNADSTPKLAATFIHNLTSILADDQSPNSLGAVDYSIANQPSTVHDLLLQKSTGVYELVIWDERVSQTDAVSVDLGATYGSVNVMDPTVGTSPVTTLANARTVPLTLTDHPLVLELRK